MAACSLFEEDEVYVHKPGKGYSFGLVLENSEFLSSSEEDEAELPEDRLHKGTVRVAWHPSGKETVVAEDKVHLLDRSLMPGDVVRRLIPGEETQCGFVMDVDVRCHLHVLRTNKYIYNVDSKDLVPIQRFESGQEVMLDSWLGRIESVSIHVILTFPDGARCQVDENDIYPFDDVSEKRTRHGEFSVCLYYPGQELKGPLDCLSDAKWLHSTPRYCHKVANKKGKSNTVHVTIEKIINKSIEVHWLFRGYERGDNTSESVNPPPAVVEAENVERLKVLDWFSHCSIQIGDRMSYRIKNDDLVSTVEPGKAYDPEVAVKKEQPVKITKEEGNRGSEDPENSGTASEKEDGDDADFEDVDEEESDSDEKHGACGGRCVGGGRGGRKKYRNLKGVGQRHKAGKPGQHQKPGSKKRGPKERVVRADEIVEVETEFTTSWATVMWQDASVEKDVPSVELFPVHHLDELEFFPGDFVLPNIELPAPADYGVVVKADHAERTCIIHWFKAYDVGKATAPTLVESNFEMSVYDIKDHPDYKFRPGQSVVRVGGFEHLPSDSTHTPQGVGQIFELDPNGHLVVKWADGSISQCYPQEVFIVSDDTDEASENNSVDSWESESDYETDGTGSTWETESEQEIIGEDEVAKADKDDSGYDQGALCGHKQELDSLLGRAEAALTRLQKLLNNFDVPAVPVPECFHDIIRIYRSCHDLDKILQSSYFSDPELQSLISQAKKELRRDKANKISKHLSQLFEAWSNSMPTDDTENVGTVAFGGKTIKIGALKKGAGVEVSLQIPIGEGETWDSALSQEISGALGGARMLESGDSSVTSGPVAATSSEASSCSEESESRGMKKETSEPAISKQCKNSELTERRPSDPSIDSNAASGAKSKKKTSDANLVGENCVSKAAKRTKSDNCDESGHEAKKSREEANNANHFAQELCFKICQNMQKQILRIHEEVNKRINRLMTPPGKPADDAMTESSAVSANESQASQTIPQEETSAADASASASGQPGEKSQGEDMVSLEERENDNNQLAISSSQDAQIVDSIPHSMDECGEKHTGGGARSAAPTGGPQANGREEAGDTRPPERDAADLGNGNEASCEISPSDDNSQKEEEGSATLEDVKAMQVPCKGFDMCGEVQSFHKFVSQSNQPGNPRTFRTAVRKELKLFQSSLPDGIFIKGFEDRLDLYSVMILGPEGTPYEDALFLFDIMLPNDYPNSPPSCHYHSFCNDRLNPNLYEDGKVCVSLLGTWSGKGTEVWTSKSNLLQVLLSIQGLILVPEPYYNEAGYERQRGTQVGQENSRMYNEMAILKTVQSLTRMCDNLPTLFKQEIYQYLKSRGPRMIARLRHWMEVSETQRQGSANQPNPRQNGSKPQQSQSGSSTEPHQETSESLTNFRPSLQINNVGIAALQNGSTNPEGSHSSGERGDNKSHPPKENGPGVTPAQVANAADTSSTVQSTQGADASLCDKEQHSSSVDKQFTEAIEAVNDLHIDSPGSGSYTQVASPGRSVDMEGPVPDTESQNNTVNINGEVVGTNKPHGDAASQLPSGLSVPPPATNPDNQSLINGTPVDIRSVPSESLQQKLLSTITSCDEESGVTTVEDNSVTVGDSSNQRNPESPTSNFGSPEFPLFPMSRGFCLTLQKFLNMYEKALQRLEEPTSS